ncbi:phosphopantothenate/pantothenate synthetase [Candidatus Woesearchaeota archaeon]|nr:phosphopantothenate/pantothenate synthetase [Candidatus Woesearchaeota archaeon]
MKIPKSHPRYVMLSTQQKLVRGVEKGITSLEGLMAHGRGESFDYLLGEKTHDFALKAIDAAARLLLKAKHPIISVNGNVLALVGKELIQLSKAIPAPLEVNIFHTSKKRESAMKKELLHLGASQVLMPSRQFTISGIDHNRKYVHKEGIYKADVVFVPLEDGDRCQALVKNKKKVITVDLNPKSRTSKTATITIVDNIVRCMVLLLVEIKRLKKKGPPYATMKYNNGMALLAAEKRLRS